MTGQGILNDILTLCDKNSNDTDYRALALIWLDLVLKDIQSRQQNFHWRFLEVLGTTFSTAADDFDYVLTTIDGSTPIDTTKIIHVYDKTNDWTYRFVSYERFREAIADETLDKGDPYIYSIFAGNLLLWPVPDGITTTYFDYVRLMDDAADSATALLVPDKFKKCVYAGILEFAYRHDPELGSSAEQNAIYEAEIQKMIQDNNQIIGENVTPISHRDKLRIQEKRHTGLFPLAPTNI